MAKLSCSASPYIIQYDSGEKKTLNNKTQILSTMWDDTFGVGQWRQRTSDGLLAIKPKHI